MKIILFILICLFTQLAQAQQKQPITIKVEDTLSVTEHSIKVNGKQLEYTATTGYLTLEKETGEATGHVFFIAYKKKNVKDLSRRPLTFSFNGGPGSSSVWLHFGVLGPHRVLMTDEGESMAPPYQWVENEYTWLEETDLVFIDPVTTGYSRPADTKKGADFHGVREDISSVGAFIRRYVTEENRWASPKFVIGESYGTTRAAGLSAHLINKYGMYLNGVVLVSSIMEFQTARFDKGNDLPYQLFLPSYAATAYYHKQLDQKYLDMPLEQFLDKVEQFALTEYNVALAQGRLLPAAQRKAVVEKLNAYTGVSKTYIERANLRLNIHKYTKELLREDYKVVGRFDSRYKMVDMNGNGEYKEMDPSYQPTILGVFGTVANAYMGDVLKFKSKLPYNILTGRVHPWNYKPFVNRYVNTAEDLRKAMTMNPNMKVWVANGYYDLATPYFATEYTLNHLQMEDKLFDNLMMTYYPSGHMMYLQKSSLIKMKSEAKHFYKGWE